MLAREHQMKLIQSDNKNVFRNMQIWRFGGVMFSHPNGYIWFFLISLAAEFKNLSMLNNG